jgi:tRNA G37 N-methylase Trm5
MAIRDQMAANAAPLLQPGETIQAIFGAQTTSQYLSLISYWIIVIKNSYRVVVVTDRRVLVCRSGRFRTTPVNEVLAELPRSTTIGEPHGLWWKCETLGEKLYINKRFHKDVRTADELASRT